MIDDYNNAIASLVNQSWTDDQANYLSWLVEVGRAANAKETISHRVAEEPADNGFSDLTTGTLALV